MDIKHYKAKKACFLDIARTDDVFKTLFKHKKNCKKEHEVEHCYLGQMGLYIFLENDLGLNTI